MDEYLFGHINISGDLFGIQHLPMKDGHPGAAANDDPSCVSMVLGVGRILLGGAFFGGVVLVLQLKDDVQMSLREGLQILGFLLDNK